MLKFETILTDSFYFKEENLLYVRIKKDCDITLQNVILNNEQTLEVLGEVCTKTIYDVQHLQFSHIPKEVLSYVADSPHGKYQQSEAFLINGLGQKLIANFYLKVMSPKVPTKIFNTLNGSLEWLEVNKKNKFLHLLSTQN